MPITQGQDNTITLTLTEKVTLDAPEFLFVLQNDSTKVEYTFIAADISGYTDRYNKFIITEKTSPDNLAGEVRLPDTGFYSYTIYEQESTTNLDKDLATGIVEIGKCLVSGTASTNTAHENSNTTNVAYNG